MNNRLACELQSIVLSNCNKVGKMLDANQIKIRIIDHLINTEMNEVIATEVSFYQGYRKADLIALSNDAATAYEIKSDKDSLVRLSEQLDDYNSTFTFCYLVTTSKHLKNARKLTPQRVGIILVDDQDVRIIRSAKENKRLSKHSLVMALSATNIRALTKEKCEETDTYNRRIFAEKVVRLDILKQSFYETLFNKYYYKYSNFMLDRGSKTTLTDLYYLQTN